MQRFTTVLRKMQTCIFLLLVIVGVANGLSKMLSLGKFTPSLGISALKNSVSESRISRNMTVSESRILKIWISESRILKIWILKSRQWDFQFFYPQAYPKREINLPLPESTFTIETVISTL